MRVDIPTHAELGHLLEVREPGCVSIYLPTTPVTTEADASAIELKNLSRTVVADLVDVVDGNDVEAIAEALDDLGEDAAFWALQANTLAVFATSTEMRTFRLPNRLMALATSSDRFHVKPLFRAVTFPHAALVLALSQGEARLVEVSPDLPATRLRVEGLPTDAASAVRQSSIRDRAPSGRIQGAEGRKVRMRQYARQVDAAIRPVVSALELPLVLAATEPMDAIFRSICHFPGLLGESIVGSTQVASDAELAASSRPVLDRESARQLAEVHDLFEARRAAGRASTDITDVARAATFGAVDTLLVDIDRHIPGEVDPESGAVRLDGTGGGPAYGVIDEIARRTYRARGRILAVRADDIPGGEPLAAVLRFAI
jgi:hypothetical protein